MGSGKSTYAIHKINTDTLNKRYLCVLPTLDECERYQKYVKSQIFDPQCWGTKSKHLQYLINQRENIVTTHALISKIDEVTLELLKFSDYTLIIDECLDVVHKYNIKVEDIENIFNSKYVRLDNKGFLTWNPEFETYGGRFSDIKRLCILKSLMAFRTQEGTISKILMWNFPVDFFNCFDGSYILTYNWTGSIQKVYFDFHDIKYIHKTLSDNQLINYDPTLEFVARNQLKKLIHIYDGKLNRIGDPIGKSNPLCKNWYLRQDKIERKPGIAHIQSNVQNYFKNICQSQSCDNMWTSFKKFEGQIKGRGYTKGFVPCNSKGTNDYKNKKYLAYTINLFLNDNIVKFFNSYGVVLDQGQFSLNELLQWIWRSQIRENKPIDIYIPSQRMRNLLESWLNCEDINECFEVAC